MLDRRRAAVLACSGLFCALTSRAQQAPAAADGALRHAIVDLSATFGARYPGGEDYLRRLDALDAGSADAPDELNRLRREALLANPLVSSRPILFVVRRQYLPDHHNTATMFQTGEVNTRSFTPGGAIRAIDLAAGGRVTTLFETTTGVARDPEVHFDGGRILFSLRRDIDDDYHVWEMAADGTGLRQLSSARGVSDVDPLYLPDDSLVFSSTREPKYCMCNQHIMANLFRAGPDGANIHQIGKSTLFEGHAALLPDGRILYDRWEYIDRNFGDAQGLWTVNPDGTNHAVYWGNNTNSPGGVIDARPIPGTQQVLCVFGSCHDRPWGALAVIDRRLGLDGRGPVVRTWPASAVDLVGVGDWDTFKRVRPRYEDPWPLSDKYFLCARTTGAGEETGIYLIDVFGNEVLVHAEAPGCFDPMPLGPRARPPQLPARRDLAEPNGTFYVADVYEGTHMAGVERGSIAHLRVVESPEKRAFTDPAWNGQGVHRPAMNWHDFNNKRILGTVPVEPDGSAHFEVPADRFVYFQLLDRDGLMVQSMRSGTMVQGGETTGCVGCHEARTSAPPSRLRGMPLALRRPPSPLDGWHGEPRMFSYMAEVQPVFDRACVRCHDYGTEAGAELNLAADRTLTFNTSYTELWRRRLVAAIGAGPATTQQPFAWGSHASRLVAVLRGGHQDVELTGEELGRIVTWIDLNAPYYPYYESAWPDHLAGRSPLDDRQIAALTALTGVPLAELADHRRNLGPQVSFDRPELSPCLGALRGDPRRDEALAIIRAGAVALRARPRADMAGFVPSTVDLERLAKYRERQRIESENRRALLDGEAVFDPGVGATAAPPDHGGGR